MGVLSSSAAGVDNVLGHAQVYTNKAKGFLKGIHISPTTKDAWGLGKSIAKDTLMWGGNRHISRAMYYGAGAAVGAGYSAYSGDGRMGRDAALGVLGAGAIRGASSMWKNRSAMKGIGRGWKSELGELAGEAKNKWASLVKEGRMEGSYARRADYDEAMFYAGADD